MNPLASYMTGCCGVSAGVGATSVPSPDAISATLDDLDARGRAIDAAIVACASLDPATRAQWTAFYASYVAFAASSRAEIGATATMLFAPGSYASSLQDIQTQAAAFVVSMNRWADTADQQCGAHIADAPPSAAPTGLDYLKAGTYLAVAIGGLYLLTTVTPVLRGLAPQRR